MKPEIRFQLKLMKELSKRNTFYVDTHKNPEPGCPDMFIIEENITYPTEIKIFNDRKKKYVKNYFTVYQKPWYHRYYNSNKLILFTGKWYRMYFNFLCRDENSFNNFYNIAISKLHTIPYFETYPTLNELVNNLI